MHCLVYVDTCVIYDVHGKVVQHLPVNISPNQMPLFKPLLQMHILMCGPRSILHALRAILCDRLCNSFTFPRLLRCPLMHARCGLYNSKETSS